MLLDIRVKVCVRDCEAVTAAAIRLIEEKGISNSSLNELAKTLDINLLHCTAIFRILMPYLKIGVIAVRQMNAREKKPLKEKPEMKPYALWHRKFKEHYELYLLVMNIQRNNWC